jgi:hypothetical protein
MVDASYQVSVHLAERFQRRRLKCEKLMDDRRRMPSDGKSSRCFWQGELKNYCNIQWPPQAILVSVWPIFFNLLRNSFAK